MNIAVVGGGTAGTMAACHVSKRFPGADLVHIFDPAQPPIGVGEGTLPAFPPWLHAVTGLDFPALQRACGLTYKLGVRFEGWGRKNPVFFNNFSAGAYAYHLSADRLVPLLAGHTRARTLAGRVVDLASSGRAVDIRLASGETLAVDFAFDARGFPREPDNVEIIPLNGIPTNAALLQRGGPPQFQGGTRAVARPHGWVFAIPLSGSASYGYIFNENITGPEAARADFSVFLDEEGVQRSGETRLIRFPNFYREVFFDGALFRIGNTASFLEPLEATAIGLILLQLETAALWLGDGFEGVRGDDRWAPSVLAEINRDLAETVRGVTLFVAWHYAGGSVYDTPFWQAAQRGFETARAAAAGTRVGARFEALLARGRRVPGSLLAGVRDESIYRRELAPLTVGAGDLGGFDALNFAQVGFGLGLFDRRE